MEIRRDIFQALADPTRRAIILLLTAGAMTPNALAEHFHTSRQAISKHLQILAECEVVIAQQKGREMHYRLKPEKFQELEKWLKQFRQLLATRFRQLDTVLEKLKHNRK